MVNDMDPPAFRKGGNGKNLLYPGLPEISGENPPPISPEQKDSVKAGEISDNRAVKVSIFQLKGSEPDLFNGPPFIHIVPSFHELKDSGIAHQFDPRLAVIPSNGPESGEAEDKIPHTSLMNYQDL